MESRVSVSLLILLLTIVVLINLYIYLNASSIYIKHSLKPGELGGAYRGPGSFRGIPLPESNDIVLRNVPGVPTM